MDVQTIPGTLLGSRPARRLTALIRPSLSARSPLVTADRAGFARQYGPWALVAGASEGIGAAWADYAASQGLSLILVARDPDKLDQKRRQLVADFGVDVLTISQDLADPDTLDHITAAVGERQVGLIVYNAALATVGGFFENGLDFERQRLNVNCANPFALAFHYGQQMKQRRRGGIVIMSSGIGLIGSPYYTHYAATKAYDIVLAEGLWFELQADNVHVLGCLAGLTSSPSVADSLETARERGEFIMTPAEVVDEAIRHLGKNPSVLVGAPNRRKLMLITRLLPRALGVREIGKHALANFLDGVRP
jgi:short-subunit dehydrogenase